MFILSLATLITEFDLHMMFKKDSYNTNNHHRPPNDIITTFNNKVTDLFCASEH